MADHSSNNTPDRGRRSKTKVGIDMLDKVGINMSDKVGINMSDKVGIDRGTGDEAFRGESR